MAIDLNGLRWDETQLAFVKILLARRRAAPLARYYVAVFFHI